MRIEVIAASLLMAGTAALAQTGAPVGPPAKEPKISQLIVYGEDACPQSSDDEIIVCARKPERERYRIPENLRSDPNDPKNQSWANKATELQYVGRSGIGSCSTSGPGGMTGCLEQMIRQAYQERGNRDSVNWNRLINEARQQRLEKIDEEAAAVEAEEQARNPK